MPPKNPKPLPDDPAQSERFVATAKALEVAPDEVRFTRAIQKLLPKKKREKKSVKRGGSG